MDYDDKHYKVSCSEDGDEDQFMTELKNKVQEKKGRGFHMVYKGEQTDHHRYERVERNTFNGHDHEENFPERSVEGWILFVTNIHEEMQEEDIMDKFSDYGPIKNMHLNVDRRTGYVKGYALMEYERYKEAIIAKEALHNTKILGQTISVDWAFVRKPWKVPVQTRKNGGQKKKGMKARTN